MSDKIKTLSQAIRLGSTFHPQAFKAMVITSHGEMKTCALGAALEAIGKLDDANPDWQLCRRFGKKLMDSTVSCPACGLFGSTNNVLYMVTHLNDKHEWPREKISDWLQERGL